MTFEKDHYEERAEDDKKEYIVQQTMKGDR